MDLELNFELVEETAPNGKHYYSIIDLDDNTIDTFTSRRIAQNHLYWHEVSYKQQQINKLRRQIDGLQSMDQRQGISSQSCIPGQALSSDFDPESSGRQDSDISTGQPPSPDTTTGETTEELRGKQISIKPELAETFRALGELRSQMERDSIEISAGFCEIGEEICEIGEGICEIGEGIRELDEAFDQHNQIVADTIIAAARAGFERGGSHRAIQSADEQIVTIDV